MNAVEKINSSFKSAEILLLSFAHFIHDVYSSLLSPLLPLLIEKMSLSLTQAGALSAAMQLPHLVNPFMGQLADRISLRYFVIFAPMLTAIPMSLIGLAPGYGVLLILLFLAGLSVSMFHVPAPVMIARMAGEHKGRGMSFFMTGGELARMIGPLTAVGLVSLLGLEGFWPIMVVGICSSVLLFWKFRTTDLNFHTKGQKTALFSTVQEMRILLLPLTAILLARAAMHGCMTAFLPIFINGQTGNLWQGGLALTLFEAAGVAGVLLAGSLSDYLGRRKMLLLALVSAPVSMLLFLYTDNGMRLVSLLSCGFMLLSTTPVMLALVQEHSGTSPAAANGIFIMIAFVARSSVVVLIGLIADYWSLETAYLLSAIAGFAGIPFIIRLPGTITA
jgi:FSR family fosmidomycin resistance protein-like MFS transporter